MSSRRRGKDQDGEVRGQLPGRPLLQFVSLPFRAPTLFVVFSNYSVVIGVHTCCSESQKHTLDQALALFVENSPDPATVRQSAAKAVTALRDRVTCRFTGPSNIGRLTYGERLVWDLLYMEGEVLNGGFHQYLTNSTGETGEDVKIYLQSIGASQTLELLRRLSQIFPGGTIPRDREERTALVEAAEDQATENDIFNECSRSFYQQSEHLDAFIVC